MCVTMRITNFAINISQMYARLHSDYSRRCIRYFPPVFCDHRAVIFLNASMPICARAFIPAKIRARTNTSRSLARSLMIPIESSVIETIIGMKMNACDNVKNEFHN